MPATAALVPLVHAAVTSYMTGVIWFVQVVHYPLFARVPSPAFAEYERRNTLLTGFIVGPPMVAELAAAGWLLVMRPGLLSTVGAALLAVIWASTALLQVPAHARLEQGFDGAVHRRLVRSNWIRTVAWTARTVIAAALLA